MERLGDFLELTRQKYDSKFSKRDRKNRRGPYPGVSVGFTRGSGSKVRSLLGSPCTSFRSLTSLVDGS